MTNLIKIKRSTTGGNVPPSLLDGEVATNLVDKRIFTANNTTIFDAMQNTVSNLAITSTSGYLKVGNSTINSFVNSTAFSLTVNSTVNFTITAPSAADYAAATKVMLANGSFGTATAIASPAGANTQIQFNDSAAANGDANLTWTKTTATLNVVNQNINGNLIANSNYISVGNSTINSVQNSLCFFVPGQDTTPTAPISNGLSYYSKSRGLRNIPAAVGSSGWDTPIQAHMMHNGVYQMLPTPGSTAVTVLRATSANTGNTGTGLVAVTPTSANAFTSQGRVKLAANNTAGANGSWRDSSGLDFWRGNGAGLGGFYAVTRFGMTKAITNTCVFIGFAGVTTALGNIDPITSTLTNSIGFVKSSSSANILFFTSNATTATAADTGMDFTVASTNWYEGIIFAPPNGANITYEVINLVTGSKTSGNANMATVPATTQFLTWHFNITNLNQSANTDMDLGGVQIEVAL